MTIAVAYKWASNPQDASVSPSGEIDWSRAVPSISEYDPVAIALGRNLASQIEGKLVGVSVGESSVAASKATKSAFSRGFDEIYMVADNEVSGWDANAVAQAIADLAKKAEAKLVLTGDVSVDEGARIMPALLAGYLGVPAFFDVCHVESCDDGWLITQEISGGTRVIKIEGMAVLAITADAVAAPVPSMKEILATRGKEPQIVDPGSLSLEHARVEMLDAARKEMPARKQIMIEGEPQEAARQLVDALRAAGAL